MRRASCTGSTASDSTTPAVAAGAGRGLALRAALPRGKALRVDRGRAGAEAAASGAAGPDGGCRRAIRAPSRSASASTEAAVAASAGCGAGLAAGWPWPLGGRGPGPFTRTALATDRPRDAAALERCAFERVDLTATAVRAGGARLALRGALSCAGATVRGVARDSTGDCGVSAAVAVVPASGFEGCREGAANRASTTVRGSLTPGVSRPSMFPRAAAASAFCAASAALADTTASPARATTGPGAGGSGVCHSNGASQSASAQAATAGTSNRPRLKRAVWLTVDRGALGVGASSMRMGLLPSALVQLRCVVDPDSRDGQVVDGFVVVAAAVGRGAPAAGSRWGSASGTRGVSAASGEGAAGAAWGWQGELAAVAVPAVGAAWAHARVARESDSPVLQMHMQMHVRAAPDDRRRKPH
jgi:hypothetical protein